VEENLKINELEDFIKMNQRLNKAAATCSLDEEVVSPYIKQLKTILSDLIEEEEPGHVGYVGGSDGSALYKDEELAVQLLTLEKGEEFPEHFHPVEKEWIILIKGSGTMWIDGKKIKMQARDFVVIEPGNDHSGHADEDSWCLCVSIPADEGYPDVSN
jgi:quercetin dioxygenase-like cupin family protein